MCFIFSKIVTKMAPSPKKYYFLKPTYLQNMSDHVPQIVTIIARCSYMVYFLNSTY